MKRIVLFFLAIFLLSHCNKTNSNDFYAKPLSLHFICASKKNDKMFLYFEIQNNTNKNYIFKYKEQSFFTETSNKDENINTLYLYSANSDSTLVNKLLHNSKNIHSFPSVNESNNLLRLKMIPKNSIYIRFELTNYEIMKNIFQQIEKNEAILFASQIYVSDYDSIKNLFQYEVIKSDKITFSIE